MSEVEHARTIVERGTSADNQPAVYREALATGAGEEEALRAVVSSLVRASLAPPDIRA